MLYEDDFEFEEQPANIRDRAIPGKPEPAAEAAAGRAAGGSADSGGDRRGGGRPRGDGGGRRYGPPLHHTGPSTASSVSSFPSKPCRRAICWSKFSI